jgi:hypothetical protein
MSNSEERSMLRLPASLLLAVLLLGSAACDSHRDQVCRDIGDCAHGGDNDWIASCQDEAKSLGSEAAGQGCGTAFDGYYGCAASSYSCQGTTASFPGCDDELAALDACLARATAGTACVRLTMAELACAPVGPGADGGAPPPACTAARDCQAQCYLSNVASACAPRVDELQKVSGCAAGCPP